MKRKLLYILILVGLVLFYSHVIEKEQDRLASLDRSVLIMDYNDKNYYGVLNADTNQLKAIELPDKLNLTTEKQVGDYKDLDELQKAVEATLDVKINDTIQFEETKVIESNLTEQSKVFYQQFEQMHKDVMALLKGDLKYHPKYNVPLVRVAKEEASENETTDNGEMNQKKVNELIKKDVSEETINRAFLKLYNPETKCADGICKLESNVTNAAVGDINSQTEHKINSNKIIEIKEEK